MGRADLARHRKVSPSDARPIAFPSSAEWVLSHLDTHPNKDVVRVIASVRDASTLRAQIAAVKMLGIALRDAHNQKDDDRGKRPCACLSSTSSQSDDSWDKEVPVCSLISSVLVSIIFNRPGVPTGLVSTALRSIYRANTEIPGYLEAINKLTQRLSFVASQKAAGSHENTTDNFVTLAADIVTVEAILADPEFRHLILDNPQCVHGTLEMISAIKTVYTSFIQNRKKPELSSTTQSHQEMSPTRSTMSSSSSAKTVNRHLLDSACDASMKCAQEILNTIARGSLSANAVDINLKDSVSRAVNSCEAILRNDETPRLCTMACAIAYLTGSLWTSGVEQIPTHVACFVRNQVFSKLSSFPSFSQLCLLRAIMEAPMTKVCLPLALLPQKGRYSSSNINEQTIFDQLVILTSRNADVHMRFLAMDAINECLQRYAPKKLDLSCTRIVLDLIFERSQEPFPGVSAQIKESLEALIAVDGGDEEADKFWMQMLSDLVRGKWHIKGTYAPLSVLVNRIGALRILEVEPKCQCLAISAAGSNSRLGKAVSEWLFAFWKSLRLQCEHQEGLFMHHTHETILRALTNDEQPALHQCLLELILPSYLKSGKQVQVENDVQYLLQSLSNMNETRESSRMRATVGIQSVARKQGLNLNLFHNVTLLESALRCGEDDIRSSALNLVVTSKTTTKPIEEVELTLILDHIPLALISVGMAADRARFRQSMRRLFIRLAACRNAAAHGSGGWWIKERKEKHNGNRTLEFEELRESLLDRLDTFENNCIILLLGSCYPGAPFQRRCLAIEVLHEFVKLFRFGAISVSMPHFLENAVSGLLECFLDNWDRSKRGAYEVIKAVPTPLAGFENLEQIETMHQFGRKLLKSPHQSVVEGGALLCRAMLQTCEIRDHTKFDSEGQIVFHEDEHPLPLTFSPSDTSSESEISPAGLTHFSYSHTVLDSIEKVEWEAQNDFTGACEDGLFYGHFLVIRYNIQDLPWVQICMKTNVEAISFVKRLLEIAVNCVHIAMQGVSYEAIAQKKSYPDDISMDSHMDSSNDVFVRKGRQVEKTACFLSMKEICVVLGILCHTIPILDTSQANSRPVILDYTQLQTIGKLFMHIFKGTRHWGVIDGAQEGFQLLCERMLLSPELEIRSMPNMYALQTLSVALNGEVYVLRRSAGIPHMVSAVLNAESTQNKRSFASPILNTVVLKILDHLEKTGVFEEAINLPDTRSKAEESVAHALNLLRSLFLNGRLAGSILKHLEETTIWCIRAFCSKSWLIKNSAMMLYSALIRRGIGPYAERKSQILLSSFEVADGTSTALDGQRRTQGPTVFQFFSRHPKLHPFFLHQLEVALSRRNEGDLCDYPALFPTLYLLSCLTPTAADDPSSSISMHPFRPLVKKCMHWASDYVRRAAAVAYVPLIEDPSHVAEVIDDLFSNSILGKCSREGEEVCKRGNLESKEMRPHPLQQNGLHGELLGISAILAGTREYMSDQDKIKTLSILNHSLPSRCWIAYDGMRNPCSYTRESMLAILVQTLQMSREVQASNELTCGARVDANQLMELCHEIAKKVQVITLDNCGFGAEIAISALRARAAELLAQSTVILCRQSKISCPDALGLLVSHITSSTSETQKVGLSYIGTLISIFDELHLAKETSHQENQSIVSHYHTKLWKLALKLLRSSDDHELIVHTLQANYHCLSFMNQHMEKFEANLCSNDILLLISNASDHPCIDVREQILILMGYLLKMIKHEGIIGPWISLIKEAHLSFAATTRLAAGRSLMIAIPALPFAEVTTAQLFVARLLEDDDSHVRKSVGCESLAPLAALRALYAKLSDSRSGQEGLLDQLVIELTYANVGVEANDVLATVADTLGIARKLIPVTKNCPTTTSDDIYATPEDDSEGNLFQLEDTSPCGEPLLRLQLCAWGLCRVLKDRPVHDKRWESAASLAAATLETTTVGSCTLEKDMFTRKGFAKCYGNLVLCLLALCGGRLQTAASVVREMTNSLRQHGRDMHPAISLAVDGLRALGGGLNSRGERGVTSTGTSALRQVLFLAPPEEGEWTFEELS